MSYGAAWVFGCVLLMGYGILCLRYAFQYWPDRAWWAVHGAGLLTIGFLALIFGLVVLHCV